MHGHADGHGVPLLAMGVMALKLELLETGLDSAEEGRRTLGETKLVV